MILFMIILVMKEKDIIINIEKAIAHTNENSNNRSTT